MVCLCTVNVLLRSVETAAGRVPAVASDAQTKILQAEIANLRSDLFASQARVATLQSELSKTEGSKPTDTGWFDVKTWYDAFKSSMQRLEPSSEYSPREYLEKFLWLAQAAIYAIVGGLSAGFGLLFGRLLIRVKTIKVDADGEVAAAS